MRTHLLIIDPQNDFCDPRQGSLYVKGAEQDMQNLAALVRRSGGMFDAIHVTLDSHHSVHIAHPIFWNNPQGEHPAPFTTITCQDVETGKWRTANPEWQARGLAYVQALARNQRYQLTIWPPHCRLGSWGYALFPCVAEALFAWEEQRLQAVNFVMKGSNLFTEHYSAVRADVPDETDPTTQLNQPLIDSLARADQVFIAGEALSHCVANTVTDIADALGESSAGKITLLRDTTSNVTGCETMGQEFLRRQMATGLRVANTQQVAAAAI